jgi:hypothetical protein
MSGENRSEDGALTHSATRVRDGYRRFLPSLTSEIHLFVRELASELRLVLVGAAIAVERNY